MPFQSQSFKGTIEPKVRLFTIMKKVLILAVSLLLIGSGVESYGNGTNVTKSKIVLEQNDEFSNERAKEIINNLYTNYVFGNKDFSQIAKDVCSPKLLKILKDEYEYDCEDGECYAVWIFRTSAQDGTDVNKIKSITPKGNGWYDVSYIDMGYEGLTSVKFVKANGKMIIDEIKMDKSHN